MKSSHAIARFFGTLFIVLLMMTHAFGEEPLSLLEAKLHGARDSKYHKPLPELSSDLAPKADLETFSLEIRPLLEQACSQCHGPDKQKADFRVDTLDPDLLSGKDVNWWLEVVEVISNGDMPPADDEVELSDAGRSKMIDWLTREIQVASQVRRSKKGHTSFRRLTRYEYNYALQDLDRRKFLRGVGGFALALPTFETFAASAAPAKKRFASFYMPDGVPMPRKEDPAFQDWSWFPHGEGRDFKFTKCLEPLEPLRNELTVFSGLSHPSVRNVHGHSNADQFLTGADTGGSGEYQNSISLDQVFAGQVGQRTRFSSLVLSTDGGTGSPRGIQTMSFNKSGRPIPAEHRPRRIFEQLFVKSDADAALRLANSQSALDDLMADARSLKRRLSSSDQETLEEYIQSVRDTEVKVEKAKKWLQTPLPKVDVDHLQLDIGPDDPRNYLQAMFELIYLAFKTDSTRVVTYQLGRENGVGASDYLARAVGFNLTHQLSHETKKPGGWKNFGTYCRFLAEEYGRLANRLKNTPEPAGSGNMLDNTLLFFGSASSAFHSSRNYPLILSGGKNMGFKHGHYLKFGKGNKDNQAQAGRGSDANWRGSMTWEEEPLSNLYLTMLHKLGVEAESFADSETTVSEV